MLEETELLNEFNLIKEKVINNSSAVKYLNLYINICENSIDNCIPLTQLSKEHFNSLLNKLKEELG